MTLRSDAKKNRALIIETAKIMFSATDISEVSMTQIADQAHIGKGTLYRHFTSKSEIAMALLDDDIVKMFANISCYRQQHDDSLAQLRYILMQFVALKEQNISLLQEIEREGKRDRTMLSLPFYNELKTEVLSCLDGVDVPTPPDFYVDMMLNSFSADIYEHHRKLSGIDASTYVERVLKIFVKEII